ncbi:hypothetical protein BDV96DRAFT_574834 [Lophiotrema nucula]|uniref:Uncharacterized protein n=1 Tax=Lophiotrema nucula TaxID=690887 RepID=A0A6A5ZC02_9PLEO|nr:hypothetical protein BDV96DRAFT_574834 [Lophiotrema nucula]
MSFLRPVRFFRPAAIRPFAPRVQAPFHARFAGDYGSGKGSPVGENPQDQGKNPRSDLEHPGPSAPKVGQNKNPSSDESASSSGTSQSSSSQSSSSTPKKSDAPRSDASSTQQEGAQSMNNDGGSKKGPQPKILGNETSPSSTDTQSVEEHNREMDGRAEKAHEHAPSEQEDKDKVHQAGASK